MALATLATAFGLAQAAEAPPAGKARIEFNRTSGLLDVLKARVEVNGRRLGELAKGESASEIVEPGRVNIKVDSSITPGQHSFSFSVEGDGVYSLEISQSMEKANIEQTFGWPPKVGNPMIAEGGGNLKASIVSVKVTKPVEAPKLAEPVKPVEPVVPVVVTPVAAQSALPQEKPLDKLPEPAAEATPAKPADKAPEKITDDGNARAEDQLRSLKRLFDQGLISGDIYSDRQRKILDTMK
jgi:hypothetical protein